MKLYTSVTESSSTCFSEESYTDLQWKKAMEDSHHSNTKEKSFFKFLFKYKIPLAFNIVRSRLEGNFHWWDKIQDQIIVGALPLRGFKRNDLQAIQKLAPNGLAVLSVCEPFENCSKGVFLTPVFPSEWEQAGALHLQISTGDFKAISLDKIARGVEFIRWNIKQGRTVYVHCKAGRGRSVLILMCYLIKYEQKTPEEALQLIQAVRHQAGFSNKSPQWKCAEQYYAICGSLDAKARRPTRI